MRRKHFHLRYQGALTLLRAVSGDAAIGAPAGSSSTTQPLTCWASSRTNRSGPAVESAALVSACWAVKVLVTAAYSSAATALETARLIAMNGVCRGTSRIGQPVPSRGRDQLGGHLGVAQSGAETEADDGRVGQPPHVRVDIDSVVASKTSPVVSSISPPLRNGVGSRSSLTCTQVTGRSTPGPP